MYNLIWFEDDNENKSIQSILEIKIIIIINILLNITIIKKMKTSSQYRVVSYNMKIFIKK